jgi:hypothetical protein
MHIDSANPRTDRPTETFLAVEAMEHGPFMDDL